jgi:dTDP-4-dehydrorhamnose 3,5-epimerase
MEVKNLRLAGLKLIVPKLFEDARGFFKESYQQERYEKSGITTVFVQDNHSFSQKDVIRGLHFQLSPPQDKLVWVSQGKIFDVVVDIRKDSPTFGQWEGVYLDGMTHAQLFVPGGFAHGFCVVSDEGAHVHYKVSSPYNSTAEKSIRYDDPIIHITWPTKTPILSPRDLSALTFHEAIQ